MKTTRRAGELTPTENLFMSVLAARTRLGESLWTFSDDNARTLAVLRRAGEELESLGLVTLVHGIVEHSFRARLTEAGRAEWLSPTYRTPLMEEIELAQSRLARIRERHVERAGFCLADGAPFPCVDAQIAGPPPGPEH